MRKDCFYLVVAAIFLVVGLAMIPVLGRTPEGQWLSLGWVVVGLWCVGVAAFDFAGPIDKGRRGPF
jgi:hypothetical protein